MDIWKPILVCLVGSRTLLSDIEDISLHLAWNDQSDNIPASGAL